MIGTLLALIPLYVALFALWYAQRQKDAPRTQKRPRANYVTQEELAEEIERVTKKLEWEWTEMYEKFNALHLRLAKRQQRKERQQEEPEPESVESDDPRQLSILPYRRLGSP